ncbi:DUF1566 domain-containing protein [Oxalobacteraceae bacterium OM1]|nr:DUF1566 domain-containing protein [Oxalobacteraceae bacterium OM1]
MYGDPPFRIVPPRSASPAEFTYASANRGVARIEGDLVTLVGPGTTVISAHQATAPGFLATSFSAELVVVPHPGVLLQNKLIWLAPHAGPRTAPQTRAECSQLFGGNDGWRLPTPTELQALLLSRQFAQSDWPTGRYWSSARHAAGAMYITSSDQPHLAVAAVATHAAHACYVRLNPILAMVEGDSGPTGTWELLDDD